MKVVVFNAKRYDQEYFGKTANTIFQFEYRPEPLSLDTVHFAEGAFAVCIFVNDDASAPVLEQLAAYGVKGVAIRAAGHDQTDSETARKLGIHTANVPSYSPHAISEHTVAMILTMARNLVQADRRVKDYNFELEPLVGFNLHHKTVGIIGMGKIGSITAKILKGFGCHLIGFDPYPNIPLAEASGLEYKTLEDVYKSSDIIIIHAPLNAHTKYLINKESIALMKDHVMIVNAGRGGILHTGDVIDALKTGKIGHLGLDVYEKEKGLFFNDHTCSIPSDDVFARLLTFKNVLVTAHMAFLTSNALTNIADTTLENLTAWSNGVNAVNEL
ncbi:MAG: 2-hydroxyacid dehydrogenase [Cytophagales bacterium]|nr:2-hydroxyacid dehydrogenase [Cytophaga sp.]